MLNLISTHTQKVGIQGSCKKQYSWKKHKGAMSVGSFCCGTAILRSSGISRKAAALIVRYSQKKKLISIVFYCSGNHSIAHNLGTTGPIQVGFSAKHTSPNEDFNQIENRKWHMFDFRLIPLDRFTCHSEMPTNCYNSFIYTNTLMTTLTFYGHFHFVVNLRVDKLLLIIHPIVCLCVSWLAMQRWLSCEDESILSHWVPVILRHGHGRKNAVKIRIYLWDN